MKTVHLMAGGSAAGGIETLLVDYARNSENENIFVFAWGEGFSVEKIRNTGCETYVIDGHKIGTLRLIRKALICIKAIDPEAIIVHHAAPELRLIGFLLSSHYDVYIYYHSNAKDQNHKNGIKRMLTQAIYIQSARKAKINIAISESVKKSIIDNYGIKDNKTVVIYNGVDIERFECYPVSDNSSIQIIFVGRLIKEKGVQNILSVLPLLPDDIDFHLSIVGDGPYRYSLERIVEEKHIDHRVSFLGKRDDIPELLRYADIFIHLPEWEEGFGIAVIEAMAAGKICIVSDKGALPEIIDDGINGFIIHNGSPDAVARLIIKLNSSRKDWNGIQTRARNSALRFDIKCFSQNLDNVIRG